MASDRTRPGDVSSNPGSTEHGAETARWPCDDYKPPLTCFTTPMPRHVPCEGCKTAFPDGPAVAANSIERDYRILAQAWSEGHEARANHVGWSENPYQPLRPGPRCACGAVSLVVVGKVADEATHSDGIRHTAELCEPDERIGPGAGE